MLTELKEIGLSDNEAKVYLAMLELGPASALAITAKAKINRPTAYAQIESLKKLGLATVKRKNSKTLFAPESPEKLDFLISKQRAEFEVRKEKLQQIMPELISAFHFTKEAPVVRYFEGEDGWLKVRREELRTREKLFRSISSADEVIARSPDSISKNPLERMKLGIRSRLIYTSKKGPILKKTDEKQMRESKYIPAKDLKINFDFLVFDDKVVFDMPHDVGYIIVQNKDIAESFKNLFEFIWNSIKD